MQWPLLVCLTNALCILVGARAQYGVPVGVYAMPGPVMPVLVPALMVQPGRDRTTTTTTTTTTPRPRSVAVAVPVAVPVGVPYAINAMPAFPQPAACQAQSRPPGCPPCPPCLCTPSCTPPFFSYCSPCHQRCRCGNPAEVPQPPPAPVPMPMPVPAPPPVVMMPYPPSIRLPKKHKIKRDPCSGSSDTSRDITSDDSSSNEPWESSDVDYYYKKARKRKRRRKRIFSRRSNGRSSDSEVVKPVLTYVSENGDVKFKKKISNADATRLLDKKRSNKNTDQVENIHWLPDGESSALAQSRRQIIVKSDNSRGTQRQGKKQIVFRPPANKKISNLTVSFQVAE